MARKTYAVLNSVLYGVGSKHRLLRPGDAIELDPADPEQADTVRDLLARDFIEDPENPKERTPEQKMRIEQRQIAGQRIAPPAPGAVRREQADVRRVETLETLIAEGGKLTPEQEAEAKRLALEKAEDEQIGHARRRADEAKER